MATRCSQRSFSWKSAFRFPGIVGTGAFIFYVAWNVHWIANGLIPPSIVMGLWEIPAPTTGMTRSTLALAEGDWAASLLWNPWTLPFLGVITWTMAEFVWKAVTVRRLVLSRALTLVWPAVLGLAWVTKLVMGSRWW